MRKSTTALNWTGTDADETKCGSDYADYMDGAGGSDTLHGVPGNNKLTGGTGNDTLYAYTGDDTFSPGDGQDSVIAGGGNATIAVYRDGQPDTILGGYGTDIVKVTSCGGIESVDELRDIEFVSRPSC